MPRGIRMRSRLDRWTMSVPRVAGCLFLFALPVGYAPDSADSTSLVIGVHGGTGQVASVLRDCSGEALHSETSTFKDVSGSAHYRFALDDRIVGAAGLRGGYWESNAGLATRSYAYPEPIYGRAPDSLMKFSYITPSLSIEGRHVGFGIGYTFGDPISEFDPEPNRLRISGHLRLGDPQRVCFLLSLDEASPRISSGGLTHVGFGYHLGRRSYGFSGISGGFYDRLGLVQHFRIRMNRLLALDVGGRAGGAGGKFEGSVFGGLVLHVGHGVHTRPAPKKKASTWDALP